MSGKLFTSTTDGIKVQVRPYYAEKDSNSAQQRHVFVYQVHITNVTDEPVTLLRRHWTIHEEGGRNYEVHGEGVVGEQPRIEPGETHHYHSYVVLQSFSGSMEGYYEMQRLDGSISKYRIPRFLLVSNLLN
ncbi:MAG: Co2+/Mg2+ efflux protein ApaG [Bacteroidota bacterium]|jgi:ApaG protein